MFLKDLRFAARTLRRHPVSTSLCVGVLGLGFAAAITVFTLVHQYVLSPLPYPDADRLVMVYNRYPDGGMTVLSPLVLRDFQERSRTLDAIGAYESQPVHLLSGGEPVRLIGGRISESLQQILGMETPLGRPFDSSETIPGQDQVVILSHHLWQTRFGGDDEILGKQINIDDLSRTVIGIAHASFQLAEPADLYVPLALTEIWFTEERRGWEFLTVVGRMTLGRKAEDVSPELTQIVAQVAPRRAARGQGAAAIPMQERLLGDRSSTLLTIFLSATFLSLMAWFNVANLLLARAESRSTEFSLRMALGSGRSGVTRLLVTESALLGFMGGALGVAISYTLIRLLQDPLASYANLPRTLEFPFTVALMALGVAILSGVLFGTIPALRAAGGGLAEALKGSGRSSSSLGAGRFWRRGLVAAQVAISVCLLITVSLLITSFSRLIEVDPGFSPEGLVSLRLELPPARYTVAQRGEFHQRVLEEVASLPGVTKAGLTYALPLTGRVWTASFEIDGRPADPDQPDAGGNIRPVSAGYFETMRIPLLEGRLFAGSDSPDSPLVALVDEVLARRFWPGESPVGQRLLDFGPTPMTIVGVVGAVRDTSLHEQSNGHLYLPMSQRPDIRQFNLVMRASTVNPLEVVPAVAARIQQLDASLPIFGVATLEQHVGDTLHNYRQGVTLVTIFGIMAIILAGAGIYAIGSYIVVRRTSEFGVRLAVGAQRWQLLRLVLADMLRLALPGLLLGFLLSRVLSQTIEAFIYEVQPGEPMILLLATLGTLSVCLLAGLHPAWRASRTDCLTATRRE